MQYFLKRAKDGVWEEVDQFIFQNRVQAVEGDERRYTDDTVIVDDGEINMKVDGPLNDLAIFVRALSIPAAKEVMGGFIKEPTEVYFRRGKKLSMYKAGKVWNEAA